MSAIFRSPRHARAIRAAYEAALSHWPVGHRRITVQTRHGATHVVACGPDDAPPVVLLHGAQTTAASWQHHAAEWSKHFRLYAIDAIGEAGPSAPARPPLASDAYAQWLDDVLDSLQVSHAAFVGISLGARTALDFALRRPARVTRLALLCPSGIGRQKPLLWWALPLLLLGDIGRACVRRRVLGRLPPASTPAERDAIALMRAVDRGCRPRLEAIPLFTDDALRALSAPALVIVGGRDVMLDSRDTRDRLTRLVPHAQVRFLPDQYHFIRGQRDIVLAFLTSTEPPAMRHRIVQAAGRRVLVRDPAAGLVRHESDALDLVALARSHEADWIAVGADALHDDFYRLDSGLAGAVLQKLANYGVRLAVVGNVERWLARSEALRALVRESNRGQSAWFVASEDDLLRRLGA
ncbi:alpha/beta hydrolase [Burkholderia sp. MSh2]|uniref:Alpha/beta hydrolase n=1 Tax=Burkholderia paludis TaxID=1506587 RepID=A0A6J5DS38_9BURK|nr:MULTISPECIES: alpha/beta fold hydrolase [Burkholderia]KEZ03551.1 alpha/beta hydrolase [Burkholderia sp. MSh2]CAB3756753.1 2-succinyl-6-hydroxy-2, 4-cyclohexadiene-1-carboxylate synthase [Burkholderia paludis]VWB42024.1 alpha/beta hydrolase [Burkholderia paludis]